MIVAGARGDLGEDGIELTSSPLLLRWIPEVKHNTGQRSPL